MSDEGSEENPTESGGESKGTEEEQEEENPISFTSYQLFVFVGCYLAYSLMLYNRKAFTFTLPHVIMDEHFTTYEISVIMGAQTFTYTISRFFASIATDHYPPRVMVIGGLFFTGFVTLAFSDQEDCANITILTGANGLMQGLGWPAVSKIVRSWFPPPQFGLCYALLSSAVNVIATLGPGVANALAYAYGWRFAIQIPSIISILSSGVLYYCLWDRPSDVGYEDQYSQVSAVQEHWSDLAGSEFMAFISVVYLLLFMVKTCCQDWGQQYLLQERGVSAYPAATYLAAMEVGGLVGSIFVGALTDLMVRNGVGGRDPTKSPRMIIVQLCVAGSTLFLNLFLFSINQDSTQTYMRLLGFIMGFCMYGAISLLATIAVEKAPILVTGAANAVVGLAGNLGVLAAGSPLHYVASSWDWFTAFMGVNILCLLSFVILVLGKDVKAVYTQSTGGPPRMISGSNPQSSAAKTDSEDDEGKNEGNRRTDLGC
ncbi:glucose-6-phosphate exchanger SLC37A4-like [Watersipora subatra]|uniref:glucose-6-phosphate exchanger SLC37A4-like n=1 Tax=Watersipora subatra TaxID=2589382 RepID=UPI00355C1750